MPEVFDSAHGFTAAFPLAAYAPRNACEEPPHRISDWYRVVARGELGRLCGERLQCGYLVFVEGRVVTASVVTEQSGLATFIEGRCQVVAESVMILSKSGWA